MKTKFNLLIILVLLCANMKGQYTISDPYDYPVKPGSEEWAALKTSQEMTDILQIPEEILKNLTTEALAKTCLNYPLYTDYMAINDEKAAISFMIQEFNGLKELSRRQNGTIELIKLYNSFPVFRTTSNYSPTDNNTPFHIPYLELLIADKVFFNQLDKDQLLLLKVAVEKNYEVKISNKEIGLQSIRKSLLIGAMIYKENNIIQKSLFKNANVIDEYINNFQTAPIELIENVSVILFR